MAGALLHSLPLWVECPIDAFRRGCTVQFGMNVVAALARAFFLFDDQRMRFCKSVPAYSRNLPGNLHIRFVRLDAELMVGDFAADNCLGKLADHGELIAEVPVDGLKPLGKLDPGV